MSVFKFQQFSVLQKSSGMKICTDTLIFGSMMPVKGGETVLDIGTGTGVLALISAQIGASFVTAIEITKESYEEAKINFENSPWHDRLKISHFDIRDYVEADSKKYDLIICNPPFFVEYGNIPNHLRRVARFNNHLSFADILSAAENLLDPTGKLYVLSPNDSVLRNVDLARSKNFYLCTKTDIRASEKHKPHVSALTFCREEAPCAVNTLTIHSSPNIYSKETEKFLKPFLLCFLNTKINNDVAQILG